MLLQPALIDPITMDSNGNLLANPVDNFLVTDHKKICEAENVDFVGLSLANKKRFRIDCQHSQTHQFLNLCEGEFVQNALAKDLVTKITKHLRLACRDDGAFVCLDLFFALLSALFPCCLDFSVCAYDSTNGCAPFTHFRPLAPRATRLFVVKFSSQLVVPFMRG